MALCLLDKVFEHKEAGNPSFLTIWFGANDSALEGGPQHVPLDEFSNNIRLLYAHARKHCERVILICPPAFSFDHWKLYCEATNRPAASLLRSNDHTQIYAAEVEKIAKQLNAPFISTHSEMMKEEKWAKYLCDGLYLSKEGNQLIFKKIVQLIESTWPEIVSTTLPLYGGVVPPWAQVDLQNPSNSIH